MSVVIGLGGGGAIMSNTNAVTSSTTLSGSTTNYASIGPLTINSGVTLTVASGANFKVL